MKKITDLSSKPQLKALRAAVEEALNGVGVMTGLQITLGNCRYEGDGSGCTIKIECATRNEDGTVENPAAKDFKRSIELYFFGDGPKLTAADLGATFFVRGRSLKIVGLLPRSRKYPILCEKEDGSQIKYQAEDVARSVRLADLSKAASK